MTILLIENMRMKISRKKILPLIKGKIEYTTMVKSDLNTKLKLLDEEKQSLVTALKILQGKEIGMNDWRINEIGAFTNVDDKCS
jgi:hypothetical protein